MSDEPKPCPKCKAEGIVDTVVGILGERAVRCINHCSFNQTIFFTPSDWNALPREDDKPIDELSDMPPCPVCGGRCAWASYKNGELASSFDRPVRDFPHPFVCENLCVINSEKIYKKKQWLALDRTKMPTPKKTERWYHVKQALIITPGASHDEDMTQFCDEYIVWSENIEAAHAMFSLKDKPTGERPPEPVADCKPQTFSDKGHHFSKDVAKYKRGETPLYKELSPDFPYPPETDCKEEYERECKSVVAKALALIDGDRQHQYGDYSKNAQLIADAWSAMLGINVPVELVPAMFVAVKIIRMQRETDNEVDALGYLIHQARMIVANNQNWPDVDDEMDDDDGEKDKEDGDEG